jgi:hypothetical protein
MRRDAGRTWMSQPLRRAASVAVALAIVLLAACASAREPAIRPAADAGAAGAIAWRQTPPGSPIPSPAPLDDAVAPDMRDLPLGGYTATVGARPIRLRHDPERATAPRRRPCVGV